MSEVQAPSAPSVPYKELLAPALREPLASDPCTPRAGQGSARTRTVPTTEKELCAALFLYADMDSGRLPRKVWTAFGWWLLKKLPVENWNAPQAKRGWAAWLKKVEENSPDVPDEARAAVREYAKRLQVREAQTRATERAQSDADPAAGINGML